MLLIVAVVALAQTPFQQDLHAFCQTEFQKVGAPAMSVAVVKNGSVAYAEGFGLANVETNMPARPDTVYRLGSITKQFTATLIMQAVNEGKVKLDEPAQDFVPDLPKAWSAVTVRELLTHTGGVPNYTARPDFLEMVRKSVKVGDIYKTVAEKPLDFTPGSKWSYSNTGYILLGMILEKVQGKTYREILQKGILDPAGMAQTYFTTEAEVVKNRASGYTHKGKELQNAGYIDMVWPFAAGTMESTVLDLAKWDAALYTEKILPKSSLQRMWTRVKLKNGHEQGYGFGWALEKLGDTETVGHGGGIHGFSTTIFRAPSKGLTVIVLCNADDGQPDKIGHEIASHLDPSLKKDAAAAIEDKDPATTTFLKAAFQSVLAGTPDLSKFGPEMRKLLTPEFLKGMADARTQLGPLQKFELLKSEDTGGTKRRVYRATFTNATVTATFQVGPTGLIEEASLSG